MNEQNEIAYPRLARKRAGYYYEARLRGLCLRLFYPMSF